MVSVFVSHSKHDVQLRKYFSEIFTNIGLKAKFMEWQDLTGKYAGKEISHMIRAGFFSDHDTFAVFVLLGKNLENPPSNTPEYTHNWVTFETGAAASCLKQVWVFEQHNDFVRFPIPFVSDYALYDLDNIEHLQYFSKLFKQRIQFPASAQLIKPAQITCPWENCNAKYRFWSKTESFNCPVCRQAINFNPK